MHDGEVRIFMSVAGENVQVTDGLGIVVRIRFCDAFGAVLLVWLNNGEVEAEAEIDGVF